MVTVGVMVPRLVGFTSLSLRRVGNVARDSAGNETVVRIVSTGLRMKRNVMNVPSLAMPTAPAW